ncbi:MAG TPA: polysaccharide biosynthesis tyrosine autokinase [Sphingomicrobium sp.]|jgi:capsular exopolysaccharide synthesis family protein|nr:polysaccharide biosynthesis tyrosine autokinase [Sphingomicrobium sp.]
MDTISPHALGLTPGQMQLFTGSAGAERVPAIRRVIRAASRWRWMLLGGVALGALAGIVITAVMTRQYASTARLEITRDSDHVVDIGSVERDTSVADQEFYQTEYGLLQTKELSERVARELGLADNSAVIRMFGQQKLLETERGDLLDPATRSHRIEVMGKALLDHVRISPVRGSRLVDVTATTADPALSQRIADSWGKLFIETNLEQRYEASDYARRFLENRLEQMRSKLEDSERKAVTYAASHGIILLPAAAGGGSGKDETASSGDRSLVSDDLISLNNALASATADRVQAESRITKRPDASRGALENDAISHMRQERAEAQASYDKALQQFNPNYPPAQALQAQIHSLDTAISEEEGLVGTSLTQDYQSAAERERMLSSRVNGLKANLTDLRQRSIQYNIYERDADTNRELYNALLQRYKEIGVAGGVEKNNVSIVDAPKLPERPSSPNLAVNLLLAMFFGGFASAGVAAGLAQIDEGIADPADTEIKLGHALLGPVPRVKDGTPLKALENPRSSIVEAYLSIATALELATSRGTPKSLSVTSTRAREGKSITALALAQLLARGKRNVVLVDADLRAPSIHNFFGLENEGAGVANFLAGSDNIDEIVRTTPHSGLSIICAGPHPPNAAELLTGNRLSELIERLQERFDHVIVDTSPVIGLADAPLVASAVESVVFVVEARAVQAGAARRALQRLESAQANIVGIILTKFEPRHAHLGYGYGYGFEYSYDR